MGAGNRPAKFGNITHVPSVIQGGTQEVGKLGIIYDVIDSWTLGAPH